MIPTITTDRADLLTARDLAISALEAIGQDFKAAAARVQTLTHELLLHDALHDLPPVTQIYAEYIS
jgi:hypothetical protein